MTEATVLEKSTPKAEVINPEVSEAGSASEKKRRVLVPDYRVFLRDDAHELQVYMPGVSNEELSLELEGRFLKVRGRADEMSWQGFEKSYVEFGLGDYQADFKVPEGIDRDNVTGVLKNGILNIRLPKAEEEMPKTIHVSVAQD